MLASTPKHAIESDMRAETHGPQPDSAMDLAPMPPKVLSDRFNETKVPPLVVRRICFGGNLVLNVMSEAFMKREHILITYDEKAFIVPPTYGMKQALEMMEQYA